MYGRQAVGDSISSNDPSPTDLAMMTRCLDEARLAGWRGEVPVGCVVVDEHGDVLGRGHNLRELLDDPTAHAEVLAMRQAAFARGSWRLDGCTLYVTLEPCPMCAGALVNARIKRLVFGCTDPRAGATGSLWNIPTDPRLNHRVQVEGGLLAEESAALLKAFFKARRRNSRSG